GEYSIGTHPDPDWSGWLGGVGVRLSLGAFRIGRYPVTVAQYRLFVADGAYDDPRWWMPQGWDWENKLSISEPAYWDDERYNTPNQPVVGVSWYEAAAFCAWLDIRLRDALGTRWQIGLPSEAQWEVAAMWDGKTMRHWGEAEAAGSIWQNDPRTRIE